MTDRARVDAIAAGRVQGVGYRFFVLRRAAELELDGWVANEIDGSVRVLAEGRRIDLEDLLRAVRTGPSGARVDDVRVRWETATGGLGAFAIRSGSHPGD